ncbi:hypothetical protein GOP47_0017376 [Adiantum capillus-veneris]|uniref:FH2 domain-containing protein n=1 Tax=Adiantum capillus-veneris TaxID=13818 RepID=A0A9D4Z941_ADICA|nr:hypothetical protein GOP47_0017376 [Adiantum capillus-veneris]
MGAAKRSSELPASPSQRVNIVQQICLLHRLCISGYMLHSHMCAAVLGQCGPRVPRFKSLFHSQRYSEEVSFLKGDRQAELQSIWQDVGEDKTVKLEEVRQMIAAAVDQIYERALEEGLRRKMALQDMMIKSENRLKEYLGPTALQVIAPKDMPLQARLNLNMSRLQDLDNARLGGYGWVGGLVVLVELRHRVAVLREMLKLPPCDTFADLDEVLASTTEALHNLCPEKISSVPFHPLKPEPKPIFQRLQKFYQTLCAIENFCQDSFPSKDTGKGFKDLLCSETSAQMRLQELEFKAAKEGLMDFDKFTDDNIGVQLANPITSFGFTKKRSSSRFGNKAKDTNKQSKQYSEDASRLEQLSQKILKKLEDINRHVICVTKSVDTTFSPLSSYCQISDIEDSPSSAITSNSLISKTLSRSMQSASMSPSSDGGDTPTSVLPETVVKAPAPSYHVNVGVSPVNWPDATGSFDKKKSSALLLSCHDNQAESLDACWAELYERDLQQSRKPGTANMVRQANGGGVTKVLESICRAAKKSEAAREESEVKACLTNKKEPVDAVVLCNQRDTSLPAKICTLLSPAAPSLQALFPISVPAVTPAPASAQCAAATPAPAPAHGHGHAPAAAPAPAPPSGSAPPAPTPTPPIPALAPPPPPPPPPSHGARKLQSCKTAKLKKSNTISRLYMGMKRKVDGAEYSQSPLADGAIQRRSVAATGTRDGMAEALAEITRRSSYFRKIEDDVQKHAASILEIKAGLESFETRDMQKLLRFQESIEVRLEQLTDESQVLARFEGFPIKKLETVRAASSLFLRMSSLAHQIENWRVEPPMSENLDKITNFFEKVKTDVEMIERTKDEDITRFHNQKIMFSFDIMIRVKEAVVGLSTKSLALAMKESQRTKGSITIGDEYLSSKDMNKLRGSFQMLWRVFQLAFRVHNFAGGHDEKAEQLCCNLAKEMETYPSSFWLELVNK